MIEKIFEILSDLAFPLGLLFIIVFTIAGVSSLVLSSKTDIKKNKIVLIVLGIFCILAAIAFPFTFAYIVDVL